VPTQASDSATQRRAYAPTRARPPRPPPSHAPPASGALSAAALQAYTDAVRVAGELLHVDTLRDFFYESMVPVFPCRLFSAPRSLFFALSLALPGARSPARRAERARGADGQVIDIQALEEALRGVQRYVMYEAQRAAVLRCLERAGASAEVEAELLRCPLVAQSPEGVTGVRMAAFLRQLSEVREETGALQQKLRDEEAEGQKKEERLGEALHDLATAKNESHALRMRVEELRKTNAAAETRIAELDEARPRRRLRLERPRAAALGGRGRRAPGGLRGAEPGLRARAQIIKELHRSLGDRSAIGDRVDEEKKELQCVPRARPCWLRRRCSCVRCAGRGPGRGSSALTRARVGGGRRNEVQYLREQLWVIQPLQQSLQQQARRGCHAPPAARRTPHAGRAPHARLRGLWAQVDELNREIESAKQVRRGALEAMEDSQGAAAQEREMRKRLDRIVPARPPARGVGPAAVARATLGK